MEKLEEHLREIHDINNVIKTPEDEETGEQHYFILVDGNRYEKKIIDDLVLHIHGLYDIFDRISTRKQRNSWIIYSLANGEPVRGKLAEEIIQEAQESHDRGPMPLNEEEKAEIWSELDEAFENVRRTAQTADINYLSIQAVNLVLEYIYDLEERWRPHPTQRIAQLSSINPRLQLLVRRIVNTHDTEKKKESLEELEEVLKERYSPPRRYFTKREMAERGDALTVFKHPFGFIKDVVLGRSFSFLTFAYRGYRIFLKPFKKFLWTLVSFDLTSGLAALPIAFLMAMAYRSLGDTKNLLISAGLILLFVALSQGIEIASSVYEVSVKERLWYIFSIRITRSILGNKHIDKFPAGELSYRVTEDSRSVFDIVYGLTRGAIGSLAGIALTPILFAILPTYLVMHAILVGLALGLVYAVASAAIYKRMVAVTNLRGQFSARLVEVLNNAGSVKVERLKNDAIRRIKEKAAPLRENLIGLGKVIAVMRGAVTLISMAAPAVVLIETVIAVQAGLISPGMGLGALIWLGFIITPIKDLFAAGPDLQRLIVRSRRMLEVYDPERKTRGNEKRKSERTADFPERAKTIKLTDLVYSPEAGRDPLFEAHEVFNIEGTTSIIGPSGSGKTSLLYLLNRTYRPNQGKITMDDVDIENIQEEAWRRNVTIVPSKDFLIDGTVMSNLSLGQQRRIDASEAVSVLERVGLWSSLHERGGLDVRISEEAEMSEGEKKRFCLARALLRKPRILLLDEVIGVLDPELEEKIIDLLREIAVVDGTRVIYVAHRKSAAEAADRTLLVDNHRVKLLEDETDA